MKFLLLLALAWCCSGQMVVPYNSLPYLGAQEYRVDLPGQSTFGFFGFNQNRQETRLSDGTVVGQYSYIDANGKLVVAFYDAGRQGFRLRANNLPEAPTAEIASPLEAPNPVDYTPEVAEARKFFLGQYKEAADRTTRSRRDVNIEKAIQIPLPYTHAVPTYAKTIVETTQFQPVAANTPADTTKIQLSTTQHEVAVPAVQYMLPTFSPVISHGVVPAGVKPDMLPTFSPVISHGVVPAGVRPVVYSASTQPFTYTFQSPAVFPHPYLSFFPKQKSE